MLAALQGGLLTSVRPRSCTVRRGVLAPPSLRAAAALGPVPGLAGRWQLTSAHWGTHPRGTRPRLGRHRETSTACYAWEPEKRQFGRVSGVMSVWLPLRPGARLPAPGVVVTGAFSLGERGGVAGGELLEGAGGAAQE